MSPQKFFVTVLFLTCTLINFAQTRLPPAPTTKTFAHPKGINIQHPSNWSVDTSGQFIQLLPVGITLNDETLRINLIVEAVAVEINSPIFLQEMEQMAAQLPGFTKVGALQNYTTKYSNGIYQAWAGKHYKTQQPFMVQLYATKINGNAIVLFAVGAADKFTVYEKQLRAIANSVSPATATTKPAAPVSAAPANDRSPLAQQWLQKLNGKKLTMLSSYNSGGGGGGMSSKTEIYLMTNGSFQVRAESSVSMNVEGASGNSGGVKRAAGTWRIYARNGQIILETKYENGQIESSLLEDRNGQTFVNGKRWFVTEQ